MKNYIVKSIRVDSFEDLQTGLIRMEFDTDSVAEHSIEVSLADIMKNRSWLFGFFLSVMCNGALFSLIYAGAVLGFGLNISSPESATFRTVFFAGLFISFILIWILFAVPFAIKNIKKETVINERGSGSWKVIDQEKWPAFKRLLDINKDKECNS